MTMDETLRKALAEIMKAIDVTPNQIRVRVADPDTFAWLRSVVFDAGRGISALVGPPKSDPTGPTKPQSIRFDRAKGWTAASAEKWARDHGYTPR